MTYQTLHPTLHGPLYSSSCVLTTEKRHGLVCLLVASSVGILVNQRVWVKLHIDTVENGSGNFPLYGEMSVSQHNHWKCFSLYLQFGPLGDKMASFRWTLVFLSLQFNGMFLPLHSCTSCQPALTWRTLRYIYFFHMSSPFISVAHPSWTNDVPSSVRGLLGSCVVIPCSYDFPDPGKDLDRFTGMWLDEDKQRIVHSAGSHVLPQYLHRTELTGNLGQKNCSLKIDPLQQSDQGPFAFRIEIASFDKFSFYNRKVSITMLSKYQVFCYDGFFVNLIVICFSLYLFIIGICVLWRYQGESKIARGTLIIVFCAFHCLASAPIRSKTQFRVRKILKQKLKLVITLISWFWFKFNLSIGYLHFLLWTTEICKELLK